VASHGTGRRGFIVTAFETRGGARRRCCDFQVRSCARARPSPSRRRRHGECAPRASSGSRVACCARVGYRLPRAHAPRRFRPLRFCPASSFTCGSRASADFVRSPDHAVHRVGPRTGRHLHTTAQRARNQSPI